jgi:hypothetical protein
MGGCVFEETRTQSVAPMHLTLIGSVSFSILRCFYLVTGSICTATKKLRAISRFSYDYCHFEGNLLVISSGGEGHTYHCKRAPELQPDRAYVLQSFVQPVKENHVQSAMHFERGATQSRWHYNIPAFFAQEIQYPYIPVC